MITGVLWNFTFFDGYRSNRLPQWIGFITDKTDLWNSVGYHLLIITFLMGQRFVSRWKPQPFYRVLLFQNGMNVELTNSGDFITEGEYTKFQEITYEDNFVVKVKWYINNFYSIYGYKVKKQTRIVNLNLF